jgi:beta-glucanase (GH16 family)
MKKTLRNTSCLVGITALAILTNDVACAQTYQTVINDGFSGTSLNSSAWGTWRPANSGTAYSASNVSVLNGLLSLNITAQPFDGRAYTSGAVTTQGKVSLSPQGTWVEVRAKMIPGRGFQSSVWLLPVDGTWPPEIDIVEARGSDLWNVALTWHWSYPGGYSPLIKSVNNHAQWHRYAIWWDRSQIIWYIDGTQVRRVTTNIPQKNMYLIINPTCAASSWMGSPDASSVFPSTMQVDWVNVKTYR